MHVDTAGLFSYKENNIGMSIYCAVRDSNYASEPDIARTGVSVHSACEGAHRIRTHPLRFVLQG